MQLRKKAFLYCQFRQKKEVHIVPLFLHCLKKTFAFTSSRTT